ncbi:hypothetical protein [Priestia megaterium]|uniref:hypothetical protein n=1 Tax=Priestia megaterium TaxID=1404 RepID=UPI0031FDB28A
MELQTEVVKSIANQIKKFNLYALPQFLWLVLLYYLMINVFFQYFQILFKEDVSIPFKVIDFNNLIIDTIDKWLPFTWLLGIAFFLSGILISLIKFFPYVESHKVSDHGDYGIFLGVWILLIASTYSLYNILGLYFPIAVPLVPIIKYLWDKAWEKLNKKYFGY